MAAVASAPMTCPHCGRHLTGHTGNHGNMPVHGDMALCWNCRKLATVVNTPAGPLLRQSTPEEVASAVRKGMVTNIAKALQDSDGPIEAGRRYEELMKERNSTA